MREKPDIVDIFVAVLAKVISEAYRTRDNKPMILKDEKPYIDVEAKVIEEKHERQQ
jgi:hypothetical protein